MQVCYVMTPKVIVCYILTNVGYINIVVRVYTHIISIKSSFACTTHYSVTSSIHHSTAMTESIEIIETVQIRRFAYSR